MKKLAVGALLVLAFAAEAAAQAEWRVVRGEVRVLCPLTIGGSFEARAEGVTGLLVVKSPQPAAFEGELALPLASLDSGIALRNDHMKNNYLEVGRGPGFDTAVLSGITLLDLDADRGLGKTRFTGNLTVHGVKQRVEGTAEIKRSSASVQVTARMPVRLADFGIPAPRYLGVGVRDEVQVAVTLEAMPSTKATR